MRSDRVIEYYAGEALCLRSEIHLNTSSKFRQVGQSLDWYRALFISVTNFYVKLSYQLLNHEDLKDDLVDVVSVDPV